GIPGDRQGGPRRRRLAPDRSLPRPQRRLRPRDRGPIARVRVPRSEPRDAAPGVNWLRVFFAGGVTSYRALFAWVNPWVFVPMLIVYPVFQILFFVYLGRSAGVGSDSFFLIGDSFVAAAMAGLFGMGHSVGGERRVQTLPL